MTNKVNARERYLSTSEVRENLAEIVNQVAYGAQRVVLGRRGKEIAALIPMQDFRRLKALESANHPRSLSKGSRANSGRNHSNVELRIR